MKKTQHPNGTEATRHDRRRLRPSGEAADVYNRRWKILAVLNLSLVLVVAANSALNVALPTLVRELEASATQLQWIVDAYAIVFAGLLLPAGAIGDRFGRKGSLQAGLTVFFVASLAATFAVSPVQVIAARAVMGIGAAFVMPATLSLLTVVFPPAERGRAIAIWAGFAGAGGAIGPLLSGALLERFWWGSVFFVNLPIIALALGGGAVLLPRSKDESRRRLDPVGGLLSMVGLTALLFGIIEGPERGWTGQLPLTAFIVAAAVLVGFAWWEIHTGTPMMNLTWFRDRRFSVGSGTIAFAFFAAFGVFFLATQYLQFVLEYSPLLAAAAALPVGIALVLVAPRSAALAERFGPHKVVSLGLATLATALGYLALVSQVDTVYWWIGPGLALVGIGMGLTTAPSTTLILSAMPTDQAGVGSAVNDTTRELGGSLGVAILGSVLTSVYQSRLPLEQLPEQVREVVTRSVGAALEVARNAPDPELGQQLAEAAKTAFVSGFRTAFAVAAVVAFLAAVVVRVFGPETMTDD